MNYLESTIWGSDQRGGRSGNGSVSSQCGGNEEHGLHRNCNGDSWDSRMDLSELMETRLFPKGK